MPSKGDQIPSGFRHVHASSIARLLKAARPRPGQARYLYLNDGRWDGTQLVPADYGRASIQPQSDPDTGDHYGYQWWVNDAYRYDAFRAQGYGGQLIYGIPSCT